MSHKGFILLTLALLLVTGKVNSQDSNYYLKFQTLGGYTTPDHVPFWLRSNQYGSIPLDGASLSLIASASKDYDLSKDKTFDWGASFESRANLGQGSNLILIEGYGKIRLSFFELRAGRSKKMTGLCDTTLTSGSWAISGSNLGVPEIELAVREYCSLPWFGQLFAFKGNYVHGWLGDLQMARYIEQDTLLLGSYLHQKSLYGRFGKPGWRLRLYGGFNHQVVWGHEQDYYTDDYTLTPIETYFYVITGKRYTNGYIQEERQGNHLGSLDIGLEYKFDKIKLLIYRQSLYEAGALASLANIQDGLNGLSLENLHKGGKQGIWDKLLIEFLYTKNQAGETWSPETASPYEPYYNHGQYVTGWSYLGNGLGTSFIGTRAYILKSLPAHPDEFFINNRVMVLHFGGKGKIKNMEYLFKTSLSKNYGTYRTTDEEQSTDLDEPGSYGVFGEQKQFSGYLELNREFSNGINFGLVGALDRGELYCNSFGIFFKIAYSFN
jgi:hypothetical protein